jgi:hypothetical protein
MYCFLQMLILWLTDPLLGNECELVAIQQPLISNVSVNNGNYWVIAVADTHATIDELLFFFNPLLFASCTDTFSKWCKITRGMKRSAEMYFLCGPC